MRKISSPRLYLSKHKANLALIKNKINTPNLHIKTSSDSSEEEYRPQTTRSKYSKSKNDPYLEEVKFLRSQVEELRASIHPRSNLAEEYRRIIEENKQHISILKKQNYELEKKIETLESQPNLAEENLKLRRKLEKIKLNVEMAEPYKQWPIRLQLISLFISVSLVIMGVLVINTIFQIQILEDETIERIEELEEDYKKRYIRILLEEDADYQYYYFDSILKSTRKICGYFEAVNEFNLIENETPVWSDEVPAVDLEYDEYGRKINETYGVFYSNNREEFDDIIYTKINQTTQMNKFSSKLFKIHRYFDIYNGITDGDILYQFPGLFFDPSLEYTIEIGEWYDSAYNKYPGLVYLTEPYASFISEKILIGASKTIESNGEKIGVAGINLLFEWLSEYFLDRVFGGKGYELLLSKNGIILGQPDNWTKENIISLIFDYEITGIEEETWDAIKNPENEEKFITYKQNDEKEYIMLKEAIHIPDNNTIYLSISMENDYLSEKKEEFYEHFTDLHNRTIFIIIIIAVCIYCLVTFLIVTTIHILDENIKELNALLNLILMDSHKKNICNTITYELRTILLKNSWLVEVLESLDSKVHEIEKKEIEFSDFEWGDEKPKNINLYDSWKYITSPKNALYKGNQRWSKKMRERIIRQSTVIRF